MCFCVVTLQFCRTVNLSTELREISQCLEMALRISANQTICRWRTCGQASQFHVYLPCLNFHIAYLMILNFENFSSCFQKGKGYSKGPSPATSIVIFCENPLTAPVHSARLRCLCARYNCAARAGHRQWPLVPAQWSTNTVTSSFYRMQRVV